MKTTPHTDSLIQLTRLGFVNAYLVREDDGFTLVDTTISRGAGGLIAAARVAGAPIRRIALTHGHGDHVGSLEVVDSPGHSPGHVAFLDTRDRSLIAGDVFTSVGGLHVSSRAYWRFPLATLATYDKPRNLVSARTLQALQPSRLALGHGPVLQDPGAAMQDAIARAQR